MDANASAPLTLGNIELFAADPTASKAFYMEILGFELVAEQPGPCVWLKCGNQEILLRPRRKAHPAESYDQSRIALVLYTDSYDRAVRELVERGLRFGAPDGGDRCATFADPDGNWFQLVDPTEHA